MVRDMRFKIAANYDNILAFIQVVALKSPQMMEAPLLLQADRRA